VRVAVPAGRYVGATSQGQPFTFDVVDGGLELTNLLFTVTAWSVPPGATRVSNAPVTIAARLNVGADARFDECVAAKEVEVAVEGAFDGSGTAWGTLRAALVVARRDGPLCCSTGTLGWSARLAPASRNAGARREQLS
jgi:hypothetical protein